MCRHDRSRAEQRGPWPPRFPHLRARPPTNIYTHPAAILLCNQAFVPPSPNNINSPLISLQYLALLPLSQNVVVTLSSHVARYKRERPFARPALFPYQGLHSVMSGVLELFYWGLYLGYPGALIRTEGHTSSIEGILVPLGVLSVPLGVLTFPLGDLLVLPGALLVLPGALSVPLRGVSVPTTVTLITRDFTDIRKIPNTTMNDTRVSNSRSHAGQRSRYPLLP
jgi:hypothetical protein